MESKLKGPSDNKLNSILIEVVENGFIVTEDYSVDPRQVPSRSHNQQVFNSKKSLFNYISKSM